MFDQVIRMHDLIGVFIIKFISSDLTIICLRLYMFDISVRKKVVDDVVIEYRLKQSVFVFVNELVASTSL